MLGHVRKLPAGIGYGACFYADPQKTPGTGNFNLIRWPSPVQARHKSAESLINVHSSSRKELRSSFRIHLLLPLEAVRRLHRNGGRVMERGSNQYKTSGVLDLLLDLCSFSLDLERLTPISRKEFYNSQVI
jgi:hypothetical protein